MNSGPSLFMWLLTLMIIAPVATLLHEIGHAVAARARLDGPVRIRVGGEPPLWRFAVAGVDIHARPILVPFGITGACEFDATRMRAADAVVVSLAGPAGSLVGAMTTGIALTWTSSGSVAHALLWQATVFQALSLILCLTPFTLTDGANVHRTDGWIALDALRRLRHPLVPRLEPARVAAPVSAPQTWISVASPACAACSHPRSEHIDLVTGARGACRGQDFDFQTLAASVCACPSYVSAE